MERISLASISKEELDNFTSYFLEFYGKGKDSEIPNLRKELIPIALGIRLERSKGISFGGDSIDRELVRDVVYELLGDTEIEYGAI